MVAMNFIVAAGCDLQAHNSQDPDEMDAANALTAPLMQLQKCSDPVDPDRYASEMIHEINAERAKLGRKSLRQSATLMQIADFYGCRLVDGRFFDHFDPYDGSTVDERATDFGYAFYQIGENLAARQPTVKEAMSALMSSPRHKANILDPIYTEVGIAVKTGGEHGIYWVQEFGRPISDEMPSQFDNSVPRDSRKSDLQPTTTPTAESDHVTGSPQPSSNPSGGF